MKFQMRPMLTSLLLLTGLLTTNVAATVRYVDVNSASNTPPYTSWTTAATNIQDAVDAAVAGDEIVVTNGTYSVGGRAIVGTMTNRVAVTKALKLRSVNGPQFTEIQGRQVPGAITGNGDGAIRCVYLASGASLSGFTLSNGATRTEGDPDLEQSGAGLWCESTAVVSNCVVTGNSAWFFGGGVYHGTLNNCTVTGNSAYHGGGAYECTLNNCAVTGNSADETAGGAYFSTLNNCTLTGNSALNSGGAYYSTLNNCIVYFNTAFVWANYDSGSSLNHSCTTPLPSGGIGNISLNPQLASVSHLSSASPCHGAGDAAYSRGTDIDGEAWASLPSIGCDEYQAGAATGLLTVGISASFTNVAVGFSVGFTALIKGATTGNSWNFGNGFAADQPYTSHAWTAPGDYGVTLLAFNDTWASSAFVTIHVVAQPVHYVALGSTNPVAPYTSWTTAATNIQNAADAATVPGALVLVTNGTYANGGARATGGTTTNRLAVRNPITVRSVNGAQFTTIDGGQSFRCAYLTNGASLSGFTLTNGAVGTFGGGGGVWGGTLNNCTISGNSALGNNPNGGGAILSTLNNCTLTGNSANNGGGAYHCILNNCTLSGNTAVGQFNEGGGALGCTLNNCTITGNSAASAGGAFNCALNNCVLYFNTAADGANYDAYGISTINFCCTTPQPTNGGLGNITSAPLFVDLASGNLRLQSNSPCINAGGNAFAPAGTDPDGNPRIVDGSVDMGAYEFQSLDLIGFGIVSNQFGFDVTGQSNWIIVLETSSDLTNWTPLTTNTLGASPFPFRDPTPPNLPQRFYRARPW